MPVSAASASATPRCAGTRSLKMVGGAAPVAGPQGEAEGAQPSQAPPGAKSPESSASAGKRTVRPSGPTAAQFMPVPQTTPMPQRRRRPRTRHGEGVVAQDHSFGPPQRVDGRRELLLVDGQVDAGQAVDAGAGRAALRRPTIRASAMTAANASVRALTVPSRPTSWWLLGPTRARPSTAPSRDTRTTSVLVLPPSNASTAGAESEGADTDGCYVALRGDQGGRRRRREHLHPRARRRPVRRGGPDGRRRPRPARPERAAPGGRRRALRAHPAGAGMGRDVLDDGRPARRPRGGGLRRRPAPHRGPGGAPRRRDAAGRVRMPGPGDRGRRRLGQGAAHRAGRARAGRGDGGPCQPGRLAGRLHQPGRDRDPGAARRGPPRRGPVQRGHLGPATDRALSRRRPRRRSRSSTWG